MQPHAIQENTQVNGADLEKAYAFCRAVAKREAKNFYWAFLALPAHKRDAMCAMYALMRRADDLADDETASIEQRREAMAAWRNAFASGTNQHDTDRLTFRAVRDTQSRFHIPDALLEELIDGTAMDLSAEPPAGVQRVEVAGQTVDVYTTLEALDRYCYLVASVVGLVTIRIFGFSGSAAEEYAVQLGKAFQYTNILRDVREDAERGRVYLPLELLHAHNVQLADVFTATRTHMASAALVEAMRSLAERAEQFYAVQRSMVAALQPDSRGAMRTLIRIYHALLKRIGEQCFQVFSTRVRVPTPVKIGLLLQGLLSRVTE